MSKWLTRALEEMQSSKAVPIVPNAPNPRNETSFGKIGTIGTPSPYSHDDEMQERAALIEYGANVPRDWAEGFARLVVARPVKGFSDQRWRQLIQDAGKFLDLWAAEAARLGWSAEDVFGPIARASNYSCMGLVPLIDGGAVEKITETTATIRSKGGSVLVYVCRSQTDAVTLWQLQAGTS